MQEQQTKPTLLGTRQKQLCSEKQQSWQTRPRLMPYLQVGILERNKLGKNMEKMEEISISIKETTQCKEINSIPQEQLFPHS